MEHNSTVVKELQDTFIPLMDPLLKYSWYPDAKIHSNFSYLKLHLHEIVYSFIFYNIIYQIVSPLFNKMFFGKTYKNANKVTKIDFDIHFVSTVQAIISITCSVPVLFLPLNKFNIANYYHPFCSFLTAISMGYFLWDLYICIRWYSIYGLQFLIHGIMALYCTLLPLLYGSFQIWVPKFLIYELSTPFVNINWYFKELSLQGVKIPSTSNLLNGLTLMLVFFMVRICWGNVALVLYITECYQFVDSFNVTSLSLVGVLIMCNIVLNTLNIFWFKKMVKLAAKLSKGGKTTKKQD